MLDKKSLWVFLGLTFGCTIGLTLVARLQGFTLVGKPVLMSQMVVVVAMFIPALSAIFTQKFVAKKSLKELGFKLGSWKDYIKTYLAIVLLFILNYGFTWLFVQQPDFTLKSFTNLYAPGVALPMPAGSMIALLTVITFIGAPILNLIPSLGEEIGWRGFLLPNLEPLGKIKAMILSGMIWALWHTPMIILLGFGYGSQIWPGVLLHFVLVSGLGVWMGFIWFKTRSTILAAFMHATFNGNAYGVWAVLFISSDKLIIGPGGVIGSTLCLILGIITIYATRTQMKISSTI